MIITKLKAASLHLLVSALIVGLLIFFVFFYWYPGALSYVSGLSKIVILLIAIDLIIGPFLTFVVYRPDKPKLFFDMTAIALIQIVALGYGVFTLYEGHPVYVTYSSDGYRLITVSEATPENAKFEIYKKSKLSGPVIAFAKKPDDPYAAADLMFEILNGAPDIDSRTELYAPYEKNIKDILEKSISVEKLLAHDEGKQALEKFLKGNDSVENFAFLPLEGKAKSAIWAISRKTGQPVDVLKIDPWSLASNNSTDQRSK